MVMKRYQNCQYYVIGDGKAEEAASQALNLPFWSIASHDNLFKLHAALKSDNF